MVSRMKTKKKINFRDLIEPRISSYPHYEHLFGVFKWMVESGRNYKGMKEALSGKPTCLNFNNIDPFPKKPVKELRKRFSIILNSRLLSEEVTKWKEDHGVGFNKSRIIDFTYQNKDHPDYIVTKDAYQSIWSFVGNDFKKSPNNEWPNATKIKEVKFRVIDKGKYKKQPDVRYQFEFDYSTSMDSYSSWTYRIFSEKKQTLGDFCNNVKDKMRNLTTPKVNSIESEQKTKAVVPEQSDGGI